MQDYESNMFFFTDTSYLDIWTHTPLKKGHDTVDGRNPAPPGM